MCVSHKRTCNAVQGHIHFSHLMTSRLDDDTKLVGSLISCGGLNHKGRRFANPHIQSFAVATDSIGLEVILSNSSAFQCFSNFKDVIVNSELGMSAAILHAGYNLGSFMVCSNSVIAFGLCIRPSSGGEWKAFEQYLKNNIGYALIFVSKIRVLAHFVTSREQIDGAAFDACELVAYIRASAHIL